MNYSHWIKKTIPNKQQMKKASPNTSSTTKKKIIKEELVGIRELYKEEKWSQLIAISKRNRGLFQEYDQIRVQGRDINVGEAVLINSGDNHEEDYVGIIKQIVSVMVPRTNKYICLCNVEWYMRKSEVIKNHPKSNEWASEQEIFKTKLSEYILAQTIIDKCNIVTCKEYAELNEIESNVYFNRLSWDLEKSKFRGYDKLQKFCLCHQPLNPDRKYIQCDSCKEWYHFECVGIRQEKMGSGHYFCSICK
ncbi:unnamed protein product (macronuclear) [Paramecium tetraurelia]|uniref:PHD-type domain-containing protein n=1 Tax=Paramecium tetraurelia TaxID=5888 RepID=A0BZG1_PARTE|nr:uncharacterized protein GSPATT00033781001 [Paramecium tetraurelia]CAK63928.1 unnamed protein product [Paramecium tetraurelia]|eukprot:XP_001431326.1 hypothetical protein (macronuclear) [Paramecium tetraurelia strain d4-2]